MVQGMTLSSKQVEKPVFKNTMADWLEVGKIVGAQGLRGEVKIRPDSDFPERFEEPGPRWLLAPGSDPRPVELLHGRYVTGKGIYVVQFAEITDRTQAEAIQGQQLVVPTSDRPPLEEDEFYVPDLIGLTVFDQQTQTLIGTVVNIIPAGNDLLEVERASNPDQKILIPFVTPIVPVVDLEQRRIEITPPPGLVD